MHASTSELKGRAADRAKPGLQGEVWTAGWEMPRALQIANRQPRAKTLLSHDHNNLIWTPFLTLGLLGLTW